MRVHYYRAIAIRGLIDMDLARQAQESYRRYVELGAPHGMSDEIQRVRNSR